MDEIEVTKILKECSDKKLERVIKSLAFLFSAAIWSHLAHSWPGLNFMCKAKYKTLGNRQIYHNHFSITRTLFFVFVLFIFVAISISVTLLGNR